jgi:hypothetical protein
MECLDLEQNVLFNALVSDWLTRVEDYATARNSV